MGAQQLCAADGSPLGTPPGKPSIVCGWPTGRKPAQNPSPWTCTVAVSETDLPSIVLDTNVVLDWLLFDDPRARAVADAVTSRRVRWIASAPMRVELERVLRRGIASRPDHPVDTVVAGFDRWSSGVQAATTPLGMALRCSDLDDQMFVDLAIATRASALVSRDRAVLRLGPQARRFGLRIVVPERWVGA